MQITAMLASRMKRKSITLLWSLYITPMFFALVSSAARLVQLITSGIFGQLWVSTFYVLILTGTMVSWNSCTIFLLALMPTVPIWMPMKTDADILFDSRDLAGLNLYLAELLHRWPNSLVRQPRVGFFLVEGHFEACCRRQ